MSRWRAYAAHLPMKSAGTLPIRRPSRSFTWPEKMMTAMPLVKPVMTGNGMNLIAPPSRARPKPIEHHAAHQRRDHQAVDAVLLDDAVDDHDERAGRPADLHPRAAERRDQEAGDDGRVEAAIRRDPARDGERDGERQRHDADDDARGHIGGELRAVVRLQCRDELGNEHPISGSWRLDG